MSANPIAPFLEQQGFFVIDGGLATALEADGHDLNDPLWSARLLIEEPDAIRAVHRSFLDAGADCIATASYQASLEGFAARGLSCDEGESLLRLSVELAAEARDQFWRAHGEGRGRLRPLVAASVGPYGAYLADGSEYSGDYGVGRQALYEFHRDRWRILAESPADLLACETIPSRVEAEVLLELLEETPGRRAWVSFSCRDRAHLSDGSRLVDAARDCDACERVAAVGINCTAPELIPSLIAEARQGTTRPIVVYPNSGEAWDGAHKVWEGRPEPRDWGSAASEWFQRGAVGIGGCCRVAPRQITAIRDGVKHQFFQNFR